ncbi:SelR-domain-containing protein, partial [Suillus hirtellus]
MRSLLRHHKSIASFTSIRKASPLTFKSRFNRSAFVMGTNSKSEDEWRAILSPQQFRILRQKGTEGPNTGEYNHHDTPGVYSCAGCGTPLYKSSTKFNSGCGWPAFFDAIPGAVSRHEDRSMFMTRTEITCTACGGHLGHVFKGEGFDTPTDERHCVNSVSLNFKD